MLEPWVKRAFAWAAPAALLACAALAGYVYQLQRAEYDDLEQRQAVIEAIRFTQTGVGGQHTRMRTLVLTVRPLDDPRAEPQEFSSDAPLEMLAGYFQHHRAGDVVTVWMKRKSGRAVDVLPPAPPDFVRLLLILLPTLGLLTFLIIMAVLGHASQRRSSPET
jgi:hypothetical protein